MKKSLLNYEIQEEGLALLKWGSSSSSFFCPPPLLSSAFMRDLTAVLDDLEREKPKALIAVSEHPSAFCAGADLKEIQSLSSKEEMKSLLDQAGAVFSRFEQLKCPKIALIQAACLGGGLEWALCFDFLLLEDTAKTRLAFPELKLGLIPALGGLSKLPNRVGLKKALSILLKGQNLSPQQALSLGLADEVLPSSIAKNRAFQLAGDLIKGQKICSSKKLYRDRRPFSFFLELLFKEFIAFRARRQLIKNIGAFYPAPFEAIRLVKRAYGFSSPSAQKMKREREVFCKLFQTPEAKNLIKLFQQGVKAKKAAFRPHSLHPHKEASDSLNGAIFSQPSLPPPHEKEIIREGTDPRPSLLKTERKTLGKVEDREKAFLKAKGGPASEEQMAPEEIKRVGVVGAGLMGREIAYLFADRGFETRLMDHSPEALVSALAFAERLWDGQVKRGKISPYERKLKQSRLSFSLDFSGFSTLDLVIESVAEDKNLKLRLLSELSKKLRPSAILASNCSSFSLSELSLSCSNIDRFLGLHFFNPASLMPLVELILPKVKGGLPPPPALSQVLKRLGKIPLLAPDIPGFIVNRLLSVYLSEALMLLEEGWEPTFVDSVLRDKFGWALGPFQTMDKIGLDTCSSVLSSLSSAGVRLFAPTWAKKLPEILGQGKKSGQGFYIYTNKGRKGLFQQRGKSRREINKKVAHFKVRSAKKSLSRQKIRQEMIDRSMGRIVNEGFSLKTWLKEEEMDMALVLGAGFPAFRGGPFSYAHSLGLSSDSSVSKSGSVSKSELALSEMRNILLRLEKQHGERFKPCF